MSKTNEKKEPLNVEFLTSLALAVPVDDQVKHIQLTIVRVVGTEEIRCYMDVVDPSKVKLAKEEDK